jgi:hypothetical protein
MGFDAVRSVAVTLERQSLFSAVVGRHTAGVASRNYGMSGGRLSGNPKQITVAKTLIYKCGLENQVRRNPLGMVSVTCSAWGMWTGWSCLSPVERPWCRGLYLLVLDGPASLFTVPEVLKERTGKLVSDGLESGRGKGRKAWLFAGCKRPRCGERKAGSGSELVSEAESRRE